MNDSEFNDELSEEEIAKNALLIGTLKLRAKIEHESGDVMSLLGTTADGAGLALICVAELLAKLAQVQTLADVRQIGADYAETFVPFLESRASGESFMTSDMKGWSAVLDDVLDRNTKVVGVFNAQTRVASGDES